MPRSAHSTQASDPQALLPTIETASTMSPGGSPEPAPLPNSPTVAGYSSAAYRRHGRKRSSMVLIPPRAVPSDVSEDAASSPKKSHTAAVSSGSFLSGAGVLAGAQVLAKLLTFILNQLLLRFVTARDLGGSSQMDLLGATILSLARDAVRYAAQRVSLIDKAQNEYRPDGGSVHGTIAGTLQECVNFGWVPLMLGIPLVTIIEIGFLNVGDPLTRSVALMYGMATLIELAAEPCFLLAQLKLKFTTRASIESLGTIARCMVTFAVIAAKKPALLGYGLGQLAYALVVCIFYYLDAFINYHYVGLKLYPRSVWHDDEEVKILVDPPSKSLAIGMYLQSIFKYLLTESDRLLISFILPLERQGVYTLASNYGSLLARLLLFPIEEALRSVFAKSLTTSTEKKPKPTEPAVATSTTPAVRKTSPPGRIIVEAPEEQDNGIAFPSLNSAPSSPTGQTAPASPSRAAFNRRRGSSLCINRIRALSNSTYIPSDDDSAPTSSRSIAPEKQADVTLALDILTNTLRAYSYLGIIAVIFGPLAAGYGLSLLVSSSWTQTDAPQVLAAYVCYIPILAWNGALEALIQSVASVEDLRKQGTAMLALSILFIVQAWFFMRVLDYGAIGLVYAQALNMSLRIGWSLWYAIGYFKSMGVSKWLARTLPNRMVLSTAVAVAGLAWTQGIVQSLKGFAVDIGLGLVLVAAIAWSERSQLRFLRRRA